MWVGEIEIEGMRSQNTMLLYLCNQKNVIHFQESSLNIEIREDKKGYRNS